METIWTPDLMDRLTALWSEGLPTAEIGRRLGISKNAVIGKAHRLVLTARPSPLKSPPRRKVVGMTLPICTWPQGHPNDKDFKFCGQRPMPGKPYCAEHAALAYVRPKDQKPDAA